MKDMKMKVAFLDGTRLYKAFVAGTRALEGRKEYLNSINVFPVPDGDTGDNMVSTLRHISGSSLVSRSISKTCSSMAEAALMGARGNSGLILAQYIYGLSRALKDDTTVGTVAFAEGLVKAVPFAEEALSMPVEGTILTVLREWAEHVYSLSRGIVDFAVLLPTSIAAARKSLLDTPQMLEILARKGVVDAGAQGFVDFLQGITDFLEKGDLKSLQAAPVRVVMEDQAEHPEEETPRYRYCTEAILEGPQLSRKILMSELSAQGDSVIIGGHENRYRIHVHTDHPSELFERLSQEGTLSDQKADDMVRQVEVKSGKTPSIALMTDSSCDLPASLTDRYRIHIMPLKLSFDGSTYLDKVTITPDRIYRILPDTDKTMVTSQPGLGEFIEKYSFLCSHYESVISVHLAAALSGTWNTSARAAASVNGEKIHVRDSRNLCSGLGLIVLKAAEAISEGKTADEVLGIIDRAIPRTKIFVSLSTLRYMVRGGRISPMKGWLAGMLNLKPIISLDNEGRGIHYGNACTENSNMSKILGIFQKLLESKGIWKYAVVHAHAEEKAERLAEALTRISGMGPAYLMDISPVIGI
ncbi:MAG: DegV family EDD domain-containing protein, partial [Synergistales bacterium]|nr:DegV family EDD domain-containing protein [Synergistales bacterium]